MGPIQSKLRDMKVYTDRWRSTASANLRGRAREYRLAAALADCPRDEATLLDLAMTFDQLANEFGRFETAARKQTTNHREPDGCSTGWRDWPRAEIEWIAGLPGLLRMMEVANVVPCRPRRRPFAVDGGLD